VIHEIETYLRQDPDMLVFGIDNIRHCDENHLLQYVVVNHDIILRDPNTCKKTLIYSSFLDLYRGVIGVLYHSSLFEI
jgi:hypothetical protein